MKKLLVVLGLTMGAFSLQTHAATAPPVVTGSAPPVVSAIISNTSWGTLAPDASKYFGNSIAKNLTFTDTYSFTILGKSDIDIRLTTNMLRNSPTLRNFAAKLDGNPITGSTTALALLFNNVAPGLHHLVISGTTLRNSGGGYGGTIQLAQTPIPAAAWLFGSALLGLTGLSRRKKA